MIHYSYVTDFAGVDEAVAALSAAPMVGLDTETTGLSAARDKLLLVQLATEEKCWVFDIQKLQKCDTKKRLTAALAAVLESPAVLKLVQNASFDCGFIREHLGIEVEPFEDTKSMQVRLSAAQKMYGVSASLATMAQKYAGLGLDKSIALTFLQDPKEFSTAQLEYAALDALVLFPIWRALHRGMVEKGVG